MRLDLSPLSVRDFMNDMAYKGVFYLEHNFSSEKLALLQDGRTNELIMTSDKLSPLTLPANMMMFALCLKELYLTVLEIQDVKFTSLMMENLVWALTDSNTLTTLKFTRCQFGKEIEASNIQTLFSELVRVNTSLTAVMNPPDDLPLARPSKTTAYCLERNKSINEFYQVSVEAYRSYTFDKSISFVEVLKQINQSIKDIEKRHVCAWQLEILEGWRRSILNARLQEKFPNESVTPQGEHDDMPALEQVGNNRMVL